MKTKTGFVTHSVVTHSAVTHSAVAPLIGAILVGLAGWMGTHSSRAASARRVWPHSSTPAPVYEYRSPHDPDGIGKFYKGREIAGVMGHEAADWLDRPEREREEQPERMLGALPLRPGATVADIGAGSGYYTIRLARRVGPRGHVYAEDIQPEMLDIIRKKVADAGLSNVTTVLGTTTDPELPPHSVDLELLVDVYHEFDQPYEMARSMIRGLKPGGILAFVEYRAEDPGVPIKPLHKMSVVQLRKEMAVQPLQFVRSIEILPWQHIILFRKLEPHRP